MPDKFGVPRPPINVGPELEHWLTQLRITLIRHINHLHGEIAALLVPTGPSGPVLIADLEHIIEDRILGRDTPGVGPVELLTVGSGLSFSGLGGIIVLDGGISNAKLRPSFGLSVIGRSVNSLGPPADIIAAVDGTVLQRLGLTVGFFGLSGGQLGDGTIDYVKIVPQPASTLLGRGDSAGPGPPEVITLGAMLQIIGTELQVLFPSLSIPPNFITNAMLRDSGPLSVIGRSVNLAGDPGDISATLNSNFVLRELAGVIGWGLIDTANLTDKAVTNAKLRDSFGVSVLGRPINSIGPPSDIAGSPNTVLRVNTAGTALAFALLTGANLDPASAIARGQLANGLALSVIGRSLNSAGPVADIATTATSNAVLMELGSALAWSLIGNANIAAAAAINKTKLENSVALSLVGRSANTTGPVADIATTNGSGAIIREAGGSVGWGLLANANVSAAAGINKSKLENSVGLSVLGRSANVAGPPADIIATADGQILTRKASVVAWTAAPTMFTAHQKVYDDPALWGEATVGTPTLALTNPTSFNATSGNNHFVGHLMGDTKISWLRFGFSIPAEIQAGTSLSPRICFILQSAPAVGNIVEISLVSTLFADNDNLGAGSPIFSTTNIPVSGYAASDYVIVDLNGIGAGFTPGFYYQGVIQRDARGAVDTYPDLIAISWILFRGVKVAV